MAKKHGYPLWKPDPRRWGDHVPQEYITSGIRIGDVGVVTHDGSFDCIFNVYSSSKDPIPDNVPDDFSPLKLSESHVRSKDIEYDPHTIISSSGISHQEMCVVLLAQHCDLNLTTKLLFQTPGWIRNWICSQIIESGSHSRNCT